VARLIDNSPQVKKAIAWAVDQSVGRAAQFTVSKVQDGFPNRLAGDALNVAVKVQPPSRPGSPPNSKTGRLRGSILAARVRPAVWVVGTNVKYARIHELGGRVQRRGHTRRGKGKPVKVRAHSARYPKRPYLLPAFTKNRRVIRQLIIRSAPGFFQQRLRGAA
jgi:phage gpG-like protein